jgi:hypothetical protein
MPTFDDLAITPAASSVSHGASEASCPLRDDPIELLVDDALNARVESRRRA